jgi:predicted transcriptional regulator
VSSEEVSHEVRRFIRKTINSVEQLEVLLFLMSNADSEWNAKQISTKIRVSPESVSSKLLELSAAQLLSSQNGSEPTYRYSPSSSAIASEVAESLDQAYREGKDTVIELIYSRPLDNIRIFADAFRLREDK